MDNTKSDQQIPTSTITAIVALICITIALVARCVFNKKVNDVRKLLILLLLEVLVANSLGKIIFFVPDNGICALKGFVQLFSDISGLIFYSAAQIISFCPVMVPKYSIRSDRQKYFTLQCKKYLNLKLHFTIWFITFIVSIIPALAKSFGYDGFGYDGHRCYVINPIILLFVYRAWVYVLGCIFLLCSFYVICIIFYHLCYKTDKSFKKELCQSFTNYCLFPLVIIVFTLPFAAHDIWQAATRKNSNHSWNEFSVAFGNLFGTVISIIFIWILMQSLCDKEDPSPPDPSPPTDPSPPSDPCHPSFKHSHIDSQKHDITVDITVRTTITITPPEKEEKQSSKQGEQKTNCIDINTKQDEVELHQQIIVNSSRL